MSTPEAVGPPYDPKDPEMAADFLELFFRNVVAGGLPYMERGAITTALGEISQTPFGLHTTGPDRPDLTFQATEVTVCGGEQGGAVHFSDGSKLADPNFLIKPVNLYNEGKP